MYATDDYLDLQRTQSNHRLLPEAVREALLAEMGEAIDRAGGHFPMDYTAALYVARRRG
jgi:hypothetical protein